MKQKAEKKAVVKESIEEMLSRRTTLLLSGASFIMSLFLLSNNITGNVVLDFSRVDANWLGGVLFTLAMIGFLVYVQKKKKKKK